MPTERSLDDEEFTVYVGKISAKIAAAKVENVCIMGDFNCIPVSEGLTEFTSMLKDHSIRKVDTKLLPDNTFTHINHGCLSRSWFAHCAVS